MRVAVLSFRLGGADGVSVAAAQWVTALRRMGCGVTTVAGSGSADRLVPGLGSDATRPPGRGELESALRCADLVVVENVCSLPMNPAATDAVAGVLRDRRAVLRHHDLPWERERFAHLDGWPPDAPGWQHIAISRHSAAELAHRGIDAVALYHGYADVPPVGDRDTARRAIDVAAGQRLLLQPTRAIARKNVAAGIALAEALGAIFWLTGPAEEGYAAELAGLLDRARCPIRRTLPAGLRMVDAYAAADAVVLPSTWEGFGMPLVESALAGRPLAVSDYPVAVEVAALGFRWFPVDDAEALAGWLDDPDSTLLEHNFALAQCHFGPDALTGRLAAMLHRAGLTLPG